MARQPRETRQHKAQHTTSDLAQDKTKARL